MEQTTYGCPRGGDVSYERGTPVIAFSVPGGGAAQQGPPEPRQPAPLPSNPSPPLHNPKLATPKPLHEIDHPSQLGNLQRERRHHPTGGEKAQVALHLPPILNAFFSPGGGAAQQGPSEPRQPTPVCECECECECGCECERECERE